MNFSGTFSNVAFQRNYFPYKNFSLHGLRCTFIPTYTPSLLEESLVVLFDEESFQIEIDSNGDFDSIAIAQFAKHLEHCLIALSEAPAQCIGNVNLLTAEEQEKILVKWNQTKTDLPTTSLGALFSESARKYPEKIAVPSNPAPFII